MAKTLADFTLQNDEFLKIIEKKEQKARNGLREKLKAVRGSILQSAVKSDSHFTKKEYETMKRWILLDEDNMDGLKGDVKKGIIDSVKNRVTEGNKIFEKSQSIKTEQRVQVTSSSFSKYTQTLRSILKPQEKFNSSIGATPDKKLGADSMFGVSIFNMGVPDKPGSGGAGFKPDDGLLKGLSELLTGLKNWEENGDKRASEESFKRREMKMKEFREKITKIKMEYEKTSDTMESTFMNLWIKEKSGFEETKQKIPKLLNDLTKVQKERDEKMFKTIVKKNQNTTKQLELEEKNFNQSLSTQLDSVENEFKGKDQQVTQLLKKRMTKDFLASLVTVDVKRAQFTLKQKAKIFEQLTTDRQVFRKELLESIDVTRKNEKNLVNNLFEAKNKEINQTIEDFGHKVKATALLK